MGDMTTTILMTTANLTVFPYVPNGNIGNERVNLLVWWSEVLVSFSKIAQNLCHIYAIFSKYSSIFSKIFKQ